MNCIEKEKCLKHHPLQDKLESAKRILKIDIPQYYNRPSYENSTYYMRILDQILIIEEFREELNLEFLTEEETEMDQHHFDCYMKNTECYDDIDVRIDFPSISHIIKLENKVIEIECL